LTHSLKNLNMSTEPAPAVATAAEPVPSAEEAKVEASEAPEAPAKPEPAPATENTVPAEAPEAPPTTESVLTTATEPVSTAEEAKVEASEPPVVPSKTGAAPTPGKSTPVTPIAKLFAELPSIIEEADHGEMWGVTLGDASDVPTSIVLEKVLRANTKDVTKARAQLIDALKWRKKMDPVKLLEETEFDKAKFGDLGYVTVYPKTETHEREIVTWNIYGGVKNLKETFGNVEEYVNSNCLIEICTNCLDSSNGAPQSWSCPSKNWTSPPQPSPSRTAAKILTVWFKCTTTSTSASSVWIPVFVLLLRRLFRPSAWHTRNS
jgi:hypothetical protein